MKQFFAFVWKEFHHILRDRRTMLILIGMPIVQIILFGFAISTEVKDIKTAVVAPNLNADAHYLIDRLDAGEYFSVKYVTGSVKEVERLFRQNRIELAVVLPDDLQRGRFDSESVQLIVDATDPNLALTRTAYAQNVLSAIRQSLTANLSAEAGEPHLKVTTKLLYNPQMKSAYNFVPGVMGLILMLICAMMTSISIVREKETGTMEVLLVSPAGALFIILSKSVPYLVLSLVNLTTILLLAVLLLLREGLGAAGKQNPAENTVSWQLPRTRWTAGGVLAGGWKLETICRTLGAAGYAALRQETASRLFRSVRRFFS